MSPIDIVLVAFVLVPALLGLFRGMLWPISVVVGLVAGGAAAAIFGPPLGSAVLPGSPWAPLAFAAAVFVAVFSVVQAARWLVRRMLSAIGLKWLDNLAGAVAAGAAGGLAGAWLVTSVLLFVPEAPPVYETSVLAAHAERLACRTGMPCGPEGVVRIAGHPDRQQAFSILRGLAPVQDASSADDHSTEDEGAAGPEREADAEPPE